MFIINIGDTIKIFFKKRDYILIFLIIIQII